MTGRAKGVLRAVLHPVTGPATTAPTVMTFGGLRLLVDEKVLRPRAWTRAQSSWAAQLLRTTPPGRVLELCAGVGHIGLLAVSFVPRDLVQVDVDPLACDLARRNAAANPTRGGVEVRCRDVTSACRPGERFAAVIADPPYVPSVGTSRFPEDPRLAVDGGPDGMRLVWDCLDTAEAHLAPGGWCLLQLGTLEQADAVRSWASGPGRRLRVAEVREPWTGGALGVLVLLRTTD